MKALFLFLMAFNICFIGSGQTATEYLETGIAKANLQDWQGDIADYTKAIEINSQHDPEHNKPSNFPQIGIGIGYQSGSYSQDEPFIAGGTDKMDLIGLYIFGEIVFIDWLAAEIKLGYNMGTERVTYMDWWGDLKSTNLYLETVHMDYLARPFYSVHENLQLYGKLGFNIMLRYLWGGGMLFTVFDWGFGFPVGAGAAFTHASGFGLHAEINRYIGRDARYSMSHIGIHKRF